MVNKSRLCSAAGSLKLELFCYLSKHPPKYQDKSGIPDMSDYVSTLFQENIAPVFIKPLLEMSWRMDVVSTSNISLCTRPGTDISQNAVQRQGGFQGGGKLVPSCLMGTPHN